MLNYGNVSRNRKHHLLLTPWRFHFILQIIHTKTTIDSYDGDWTMSLSCLYKLYFWKLFFFSILGTCNRIQPLPLPPLPEIKTVNGKDLGTVTPCDFVVDAWVLFLSSLFFLSTVTFTSTASVIGLSRPGSSGEFDGAMLCFTINSYVPPLFSFSFIYL